ncbi:HAD hydrolase-like protein [Mangrovicella endophytica]|uniref:HAD hydrolase-like protein n=1 Tax=Mangrovicella endophytica TaxID=2066697 RepID=UPI000C9E0A42|nr:HAD hydrolase-like protein [Mangrovicella endophytica]
MSPSFDQPARSETPPRPLAVFDLDGTLVDTAPDLSASLDHCLAAVGMAPVPLELIRPHAGHGARVMIRKAYEWVDRPLGDDELGEQVVRFLAHYEAHICVRSRPFDGVVAAMDRLERDGFTLAVCTNKYEHLAVKLLGELGLADRFATICGADTFGGRKPDPMHLGGTIARAGAAAATSVMIGDTMTDVAAALALDVPSILIDFGYAPDAEARAKASRVIETYSELKGALLHQLMRR